MHNFKPTEYKLLNVATNRIFEDDGWMLADPQCDKPSLVRSIFSNKQLNLRTPEHGFYIFADWLPIHRILKKSSSTITYKSTGLANHLGLDNLYISFSGYWPEKGVNMTTCSFKETEAYSVCGRLATDERRVLLIASAGNTARAFARVCSDNDIPLLLCVPEDNLDALWFNEPLKDCVKLVATPKGSDYFDAIQLSSIIANSEKFLEEGGAKNVARRDGMGTTVLSATTTIGRIPDAYFQAIGSGTGVIAAWEANLRLIEDGRYGLHKMKLFPSQNHPFTPMYDAWQCNCRDLLPMDEDQAREKALAITAKVLSNRRPPYSIVGGLFDAMKDAGGSIEIASNEDILYCKNLFQELEGIDIYSAAAVALKGLMISIEKGDVKKDEVIMLNITGGGEERIKSEYKISYLSPSLVIDPNSNKDAIIKSVEELF